jgi:amidase
VPVAVKNNSPVAGLPTRLGTASAELPAPRDGDLAVALRRAGCVILGTTTMSELALHPYGPAVNPWDRDRTAGGSSGGSAAAVAAGLVPAATASDGGGSIRIPAASCGLFGLKPTPGLLPEGPDRSRWHGLAAVGFLTRSVLDTAVLLDAVCGGPGYAAAAAAGPERAVRVAVSHESALPIPLDPACAEALDRAAEALAAAGHLVADGEPALGRAASAFVPRYLRSARDAAVRLVDPDRLAPAAKLPARLGALVSDAAIEAARRRGERWTADVTEAAFADADVLLTPVLATPADPATRFAPAHPVRTALRSALRTAYVAPWNVAGFPAASVPFGFTTDGLPLAVQLVGVPGSERLLIALAAQLQRASDWTVHCPTV